MTDGRAVREEVNPQGGSLVSRLYICFFLLGLFFYSVVRLSFYLTSLFLFFSAVFGIPFRFLSISLIFCSNLRYNRYFFDKQFRKLIPPGDIREECQFSSLKTHDEHLV